MAIPSIYTYMPNGLFTNNITGAAGYSISQVGIANLLSNGPVSSSAVGFSPGPRGYWYYQDGSGPYVKNADGLFQLFLL